MQCTPNGRLTCVVRPTISDYGERFWILIHYLFTSSNSSSACTSLWIKPAWKSSTVKDVQWQDIHTYGAELALRCDVHSDEPSRAAIWRTSPNVNYVTRQATIDCVLYSGTPCMVVWPELIANRYLHYTARILAQHVWGTLCQSLRRHYRPLLPNGQKGCVPLV